ncbi:MAG: ferrochelatase, partial [Streptomycetales bacterium]
AALRKDFAAHRLDLPVYWGNRNWTPYLADTMRTMAADGVRRAIVVVTAAYASYSGCRQYREDLADARRDVGSGAPGVDKLRLYFDHPGFVTPMVRSTLQALARVPAALRAGAHLAFTTHSLPETWAAASGPYGESYVAQHLEAARLVAEGVAAGTGAVYPWRLAYQSRSGPPGQPWLGPDISDHLHALAGEGVRAVVMVPVGFVSDHMEVRFDLDVVAAEAATALGVHAERAATAGTAPEFVSMLRELVLERAAAERGQSPERRALGRSGPAWDVCPAGCCPNPRGPRPAAAGG